MSIILNRDYFYVPFFMFLILSLSFSPILSAKESGPLILNAPSSVEFFVGREAELEEVYKGLRKEGAIAIVGGSGVGKSQVVKEYIKRNNKEYDIIWWFDGKKDLSSQFLNFALALAKFSLGPVLSPRITFETAIQYTKDVLRLTEARWLLVFDDVYNHEDLFLDFIGHRGHVVITSQNKEIYKYVLPLQIFSRDESINLLTKVIGKGDKKDLSDLASRLSNFPVSLVQAGSYLKFNLDSDIKAYLTLFETERKKLIEEQERFVRNNRGLLPSLELGKETFSVSYSLTFNKIKKEDPMAFEILNMIAYLYHQGIVQDLFIMKEDPKRIEKLYGLATLTKYNVLEKQGSSYSTHELIQTTIRDKVEGQGDKRASLLEAINGVKNQMIEHRNKTLDPAKSEALLAHAMRVIDHADKAGLENKDVVELKIYIVDYYFNREKGYLVKSNLIKSIDTYIKAHKDIDPLTLMIYYAHRLSFAQWYADEKEEYNLYVEKLKKSLETLKGEPQKIAEDKASALDYLARFHLVKGEYKEAQKYINAVKELLPFISDLMKAWYYNLVKRGALQQGDLDQAENAAKDSMKYADQISDALTRASFLFAAADPLVRKGKIEEARKYAEESYNLAIKESQSSNKKPFAAGNSSVILGACHLKRGDLDQAIKRVKEGLEILEAFYRGPDKVQSQAYAHMVTGDIFREKGDLSEAWREYQQAEKIYKKVLSNIAIADVAYLYEQMSITAAAMSDQLLFKDSFKRLKDLFGGNHPSVARVIKYLVDKDIEPPLGLLDPLD